MTVLGFDHVQMAMPPGEEDAARRFYCGLLGFSEQPKPAELARRGGLWLRAGQASLHLGIETEFRPARKAHPALLVDDLATVLRTLEAHGYAPAHDVPLAGYQRAFVNDPFGNRIELLERDAGAAAP